MKRNRFLSVVAGSVVSMVLAGVVWGAAGRVGLVTTKDGTAYEGAITERDNDVVIDIKGISTTLPREKIASIDYSTYADRFKKQMTALSKDDAKGRLKLAREAFDRKEYALSQSAVNEALLIEPTNEEARSLDALIASTQQLANSTASGTRPPTAGGPTATAGEPMAPSDLLSPAQIEIIRKNEMKSGDKINVQFANGVQKRYVEANPGMNFKEFTARLPVDKALEILDKGSDDMKADVHVRADPPGVAVYVKTVNTAVVQGCASSNCHGQAGAGNFRLATEGANAAITNFYLLTHYRSAAPLMGRAVRSARRRCRWSTVAPRRTRCSSPICCPRRTRRTPTRLSLA
ncbi:MAG: hypothetical protein QM770_16780 [Tepidisphaeraceae bacterium]